MIPAYLKSSRWKGRRIHVGCCGSIAAYKTLDLCRVMQKSGLSTSAVLTAAAENFITRLSLEALDVHPVHTEMFRPATTLYDHLEPGHNASLMLVHPATANSMAKIASGMADTMLTCQALAFPGPLLIVPAMNPNLWNAPATLENAERLRNRENTWILTPDAGLVACGDQGTGKLPTLMETFFHTLKLSTPQDMAGLNVLITLGATREFWDPVRFWSNPSSGRMGGALAVGAWLRGGEVHCVCAPSDIWLPRDVSRTEVVSAREMHTACLDLWPRQHIGCLSAAVCDFRPQESREEKFKKASAATSFSIPLVPNPDILKTLGGQKSPSQRLVGFAAESDPGQLARAKEKLVAKNLDLLAANLINQPDTGFEHHTNAVLLIPAHGEQHQLPLMSKLDIAGEIWDWILKV